ncbi:acyl-CoA dehydrogenase family member 11 isoform X1 [Salmo trutta]|uniref:acyl-CoA dehydrogenase family member 11 isoform X1 n=1 Tax=Salmo trutta TaxID=8032 RepID=UPI001130D969|nr:acyl-CoA dehydrogenase family member 11-like isoform X1 [Salmo trutta]
MTSSLSDNAGVPTPEDLISIYCRCRGIPSSLPQLNFYLALSVFKMGIYVRHLLCNASAPNAAQFGQSVEPLAQVGLQIAQRRWWPTGKQSVAWP